MNLKPGETLIAKKIDCTSGSIGWFGGGVNDAYDIYLIKKTNGHYVLVLFMEIQFFFEDSDQASWLSGEKSMFIQNFKTKIDQVWGGNKLLKMLSRGKKVTLEMRFDTKIDGWSTSEHWEITVTKIRRGSFSTSSVNPFFGTVKMDSEDVNFVNKGFGQSQRGVVHEFGHMLGLPDEYKLGTRYAGVYNSIMNRGETVFVRHNTMYKKWLSDVLLKKGIN